MQYYRLIITTPKKCAIIAHIYATISYIFDSVRKLSHLCIITN
nr:MAG TPA: hypothetical protein [Caudoviricetes sp.]DAK55409.1 MAG TPA: hypothetical protein [Caudoviricetes sp.]